MAEDRDLTTLIKSSSRSDISPAFSRPTPIWEQRYSRVDRSSFVKPATLFAPTVNIPATSPFIVIGTLIWERNPSSRNLFSMGRRGLISGRLLKYSALPVSNTTLADVSAKGTKAPFDITTVPKPALYVTPSRSLSIRTTVALSQGITLERSLVTVSSISSDFRVDRMLLSISCITFMVSILWESSIALSMEFL